MQSLEGLDFIDRMREISSRMRSRLDKISTEEATKNGVGDAVYKPHTRISRLRSI